MPCIETVVKLCNVYALKFTVLVLARQCYSVSFEWMKEFVYEANIIFISDGVYGCESWRR